MSTRVFRRKVVGVYVVTLTLNIHTEGNLSMMQSDDEETIILQIDVRGNDTVVIINDDEKDVQKIKSKSAIMTDLTPTMQ
jgi:hypothetical protein